MFASWFITIFAVNAPADILSRVWDLFILQGMKMIYKIIIALLKINEELLLSLMFDEIMEKIKFIYNDIDKETLIKTALGIKITNKSLEVSKKYKISLKFDFRCWIKSTRRIP